MKIIKKKCLYINYFIKKKAREENQFFGFKPTKTVDQFKQWTLQCLGGLPSPLNPIEN